MIKSKTIVDAVRNKLAADEKVKEATARRYKAANELVRALLNAGMSRQRVQVRVDDKDYIVELDRETIVEVPSTVVVPEAT